MRLSQINSLTQVNKNQWNALLRDNNPFLKYEFLSALECHGCVGETFGWYPCHIVAEDHGELVAACPLYIKDNSYGELVFDHAWADAWARAGQQYYPKLVSALPYTPVTSDRLLIRADQDQAKLSEQLIEFALQYATQQQLSSLHWLFPSEPQCQDFAAQGHFIRSGYQFHWHNRDYRQFEDYLKALSSKKRKAIRRERRLVKEAGVTLRRINGREANEQDWVNLHHFYRITFERKSGYATFNLAFFHDIAASMGEQILLVFAEREGKTIAAALMLQSEHTLYGRHWGCDEFVDGLHFETCYYQGIEHCIENGLATFEPGAQGEFKLSRGFLPTRTWSAHWLAHPEFHRIIRHHTEHETGMLDDYLLELADHSPYRN